MNKYLESGDRSMARPKKYTVNLSDEEVKQLEEIIHDKNVSRTLRKRCSVLLNLDETHGKVITYVECEKISGACRATVANIAKMYCTKGIDAVIVLNRNVNSDTAKRKLDCEAEKQLLEIASGQAPEGYSRWTLRLLADASREKLGIPVSKDTIRRILRRADGLQK